MAKKKTKTRPARKAPARKTTVMVLSKRRGVPSKVTVLPPDPPPNGYTVAADGSLQLGALGLIELKLTNKEERVCAERVNPDDVLWRASRRDGPKDIPYLPHPVYTRWFNRAFGRTGWNLVPIGKPTKSDTNVVLLPYVLHVHTKPVAFAWGEQEYYPQKADGSSNRAQTYGDVIESTVGSALRRCAKHLGIGLELWDKQWIAQLTPPGSQPPQQQRQQQRRRNGNSRPPAPVEHADLDAKITDDQRLKLWNTSRRCGRGDQEVQTWLKQRYKVNSSTDITRRQFDDIMNAIERPGPLPEKV